MLLEKKETKSFAIFRIFICNNFILLCSVSDVSCAGFFHIFLYACMHFLEKYANNYLFVTVFITLDFNKFHVILYLFNGNTHILKVFDAQDAG